MKRGKTSLSQIAFPKPNRKNKPKKKLKTRYKSIPVDIKRAVLEEKGRLCFLGHCPNCGAAPVTINDDFHHYPHRSKGGKDIPEHLWPCRRECHDYIHDHPLIERAMFNELEKAGYKVIWKVETKGIGLKESAG
jgi:5-methylcytosine-specific restriction endonuclease McrA